MKFSEVFGTPGDLKVWTQLAEEIGGQFWGATPEYMNSGGIGHTVHLKVEQGPVFLEAFTDRAVGEPGSEQVRMRAPYQDKDGFRFTISREHLFTGLGKLFGAQDVETGDPAFDDDFVIKSNDEAKARVLFADPRIRQLLREQPYVFFQARDSEAPPGSPLLGAASTELYFLLRHDQAKDIARLKALFELFTETLGQFRAIGSA
ncbi:MAG TPA: DUF3137 domain-containing protein [Blastocatellia bacterium]|jgi:hypothetical protein|nr:DUF3137 domain-containing protein [Blastocatellia bacterium]